MAIKIFHMADLHIGMKFSSYPDAVKGELKKARVDALQKMVEMANGQGCNMFVVAGDLFHKNTGIAKKDIASSVKALEAFNGECVLVLPGNHDFDNEMIQLWDSFKSPGLEKIVFINEERPYPLDEFDLDAVIYPAPCHSKHSYENNIGWIKDESMDDGKLNIAVAHGSIDGISPDLNGEYFPMSMAELNGLPVDLCLLGHTHVPYPTGSDIRGIKVFNPGTPEPDGLDCGHDGNAWIISVDDQKNISAEAVETGIFRFIDREFTIREIEDYSKIAENILSSKSEKTVARIRLVGSTDEDVFKARRKEYEKLEEKLAHLIIDDSGLGIKISREKIEKEFLDGSFPQKLLTALSDDEGALQIAYELIMGVKK